MPTSRNNNSYMLQILHETNQVHAYDARILLKIHVPVSDTVLDTDTSRILLDTYPRCIGNFCEFK